MTGVLRSAMVRPWGHPWLAGLLTVAVLTLAAAAATPPTAAELFNGATGTGKGPTNVTFTAKITVPAYARSEVLQLDLDADDGERP
jgi:hypothetical protein